MLDSLVILYRVFCQPTALVAEVGKLRPAQRLVFMLRMAPWMLAMAAATVGSLSLILHVVGLLFHWAPAYPWWVPALMGVASGVIWGTVWRVVPAVAWGAIWGPAQWLIVGVIVPLVPTVSPGITDALTRAVPICVALGMSLGLGVGTAQGAVWGLVLGVGLGLAVAPAGRWTGAILCLGSFLLTYFRLEWYALDAEATLWQFWRARVRPEQARLLLRRSPVYWREPVWPPLVGLRSFLRLVGEHDYRGGVEECLFVISERPTQAAVARKALLEIIAQYLARLNTIQEIAGAAREVERARAQAARLPQVLAEALPTLEELARYAEQHLSATLPHNRRRALERLRDGAEGLGRRLALEHGALARMLLGVARRWREVAERRLAHMDEAEELAGFVHNPFVFGQPIEETETNLFVGRRDVVRQIEVSLLGGTAKPALVLWGPRRMGKTSVLLQLPRLLGSEFVPAFVDMQAMQVRESIAAFFRALTEASAAALRRRGIGAAPLQMSDLADSPFTVFANWMEGIEQMLGDKRYLLLCLDEFERLETSIQGGSLPRELMDQLRHIIQHHPRVVVLVSGSHRPDEMELNWSDTLISTKLIQVSYLEPDEARQLITRPVPNFDIGYRPESVARIVEVTRCQPYLVQAVCFELVNLLNVAGRREALPEDVEEAVQQALDSTRLYFAEMWRQLNDWQQGLSRAISEAPEGLNGEQLRQATGRERSQVAADLRLLATRSIVEQQAETERYRFQVPMVGMWVRTRSG